MKPFLKPLQTLVTQRHCWVPFTTGRSTCSCLLMYQLRAGRRAPEGANLPVVSRGLEVQLDCKPLFKPHHAPATLLPATAARTTPRAFMFRVVLSEMRLMSPKLSYRSPDADVSMTIEWGANAKGATLWSARRAIMLTTHPAVSTLLRACLYWYGNPICTRGTDAQTHCQGIDC